MRFRLLGLLIALLAVSATARAADEAPAWLRQAAATQAPVYDKKVTEVVLVDESTTTVSEDGRVTKVTNFAVRILSREGREAAEAEVLYYTDMGKVREIRAWLIRPSGQVKSYGKDTIIDQAQALNDVYDESRVKRISAIEDAEPGAVFGFTATSEERPFFNQLFWYFQGSAAPVVSSRLTLVLPTGWNAKGITFNHPAVEPVKNGNAYTWELRNLAPFEIEPASPKFSNLSPRLEVKFFPTEGVRGSAGRSFDSWGEVSNWYTELTASQAVPDESLMTKARELTANARTEFERIRAIGNYVQNIQYISIQIGVGRWRPHAAAQVLAKSYGDCKDKANLMRALLKAVNIESYPVLIYAGDPSFVREAWPSPYQFNHCIIAVKVSDETKASSILQHPMLGRLLIFDATDDNTTVGDLPEHEQSSFALVACGDKGTLERMPVIPPESSALVRQIDGTLDPMGLLTATLSERSIGQSAAVERSIFRSESRPDYVKRIERWVTGGATGARVSKVDPRDERNGDFNLDVDFVAPAYAQLMQDRLLVFKPAIVSRRESLALTETKRKHPVVLTSHVYSEKVRLKLPAGFDVDEMPDPVKLETSFGSYTTTYEVKDGQLFFTRKLVQRAGTIPVEQYNSVRSFFERIRAAEQSPVVLARK